MPMASKTICATAALALLIGARAAVGASWDERVFSSHVDFDAIAAAGAAAIPDLIARGKTLFKAKFTTADGAGRPKATQAIVPTKRKFGVNPAFARTSGPDSNSCFGCHNDPIEGGSGDDVANAFVSEGFESAQFDSTDPSFSSERHTTALMGAGLIELLAREMTADLQGERAEAVKQARAGGQAVRADLVSKGVRFGSITAQPDGIVDLDSVEGVDADLIVRPFSRKGVFTSLRQFTINALNAHHGMEASERFGVRWTGSHDFDESGVPDAVSEGDVTALVAFQATLAPPTVKSDLPDDWRAAVAEGRRSFEVARMYVLPSTGAAAKIADLHRSGALRHGRHLARRRSEEGGCDRSIPARLGARPAKERQGRNAHSAVQRPQAPSDRRRSGQRARQ